MLNCLILKRIVLIKKFNILEKDVCLCKTKDMQRFIIEKIDFDK